MPPAKHPGRPWHVPSRHPHQSHRGLPGPAPAATSRQLVQTWREMTAEHPALSSSRLLWGSRGWLGCVVGATAGWEIPYWGGGGGACETSVPVRLGSCSPALAAFNCFVPASLCWWSLPPCPSEPRQRGMNSLWQVNVGREAGGAQHKNLADWKNRNNHPDATGAGGLWCCRELGDALGQVAQACLCFPGSHTAVHMWVVTSMKTRGGLGWQR